MSDDDARAGLVVAIDGPAGAGKSTVARALARALGVPHVDTGAFYRAATLAALRRGVDLDDPEACAMVVDGLHVERVDDRTLLDGEDVEAEIRGAAVTGAVSRISAHQPVRVALVAAQRAATAGGAVVEGRDAGTAVVPDAPLKVWLTAAVDERAERRAAQLGADPAERAAHAAALARRDRADAVQMVPAADAVVVDTTARGVETVVAEITALVTSRMVL